LTQKEKTVPYKPYIFHNSKFHLYSYNVLHIIVEELQHSHTICKENISYIICRLRLKATTTPIINYVATVIHQLSFMN